MSDRCTAQRETRFLELDVVRGVAILLVIGRHVESISVHLPWACANLLQSWQWVGWAGVDLFFVLSGFLVGGLLFSEYQRTGSIDLCRFLLRRGFKIYPAFYMMLATSYILSSVWGFPRAFRFVDFLGEIFFIQNYFASFWNHTWSLAVEEHFYIGLPLVLLWELKRKGNLVAVPRLCLMIIPIVLLSRLGMVWFSEGVEYGWGPAYSWTHNRLEGLLLGLVISWCYHFHCEKFLKFVRHWDGVIFLFGLLFVVAPHFSGLGKFHWEFTARWGLSLNALGFAGLITVFTFSERQIKHRLFTLLKPLASVGLVSYSIYLWNPLVYNLVFDVFFEHPEELSTTLYLPLWVLYLILSILVGWLMSRLVEAPALRLRERLCPKDVVFN